MTVLDNIDDIDRNAEIQMRKFEADLPSIIIEHAGEWVAYLDRPRAFFPRSECANEAVEWVLENLGYYAGCLVIQVPLQ